MPLTKVTVIICPRVPSGSVPETGSTEGGSSEGEVIVVDLFVAVLDPVDF